MSSREQAVVKARDVITAWKACVLSQKTPGSRAVVDIKTEDLIEVLLDGFEGDVTEEEAQQVFSNNGGTSGGEVIPASSLQGVPEPLVPVVLMRELLHTHRVMFNPKNVANWREFTRKFGKYMLAG